MSAYTDISKKGIGKVGRPYKNTIPFEKADAIIQPLLLREGATLARISVAAGFHEHHVAADRRKGVTSERMIAALTDLAAHPERLDELSAAIKKGHAESVRKFHANRRPSSKSANGARAVAKAPAKAVTPRGAGNSASVTFTTNEVIALLKLLKSHPVEALKDVKTEMAALLVELVTG